MRPAAVAVSALCGAGGRAAGIDAGESLAPARPRTTSIKEYLSRGTYIYPAGALAAPYRRHGGLVAYRETPKFNPINVCSYHLQEAGATPEQELAYALATAIAVLDAVKCLGCRCRRCRLRHRGRRASPSSSTPACGSSPSFARCGRSPSCGTRSCASRYGVADPETAPLPLWRPGQLPGVDRAAAGEQRLSHPDRNAGGDPVQIDARARAVQLPAWNEALGLPRPWDQQWSLRMQQVLAYETDLLEYERPVRRADQGRRGQGRGTEGQGGRWSWRGSRRWAAPRAAIETGYMKHRARRVQCRRVRAIETGELTVVGVNRWTETEALAAHRRREGKRRRSAVSSPSIRAWKPRSSPASKAWREWRA